VTVPDFDNVKRQFEAELHGNNSLSYRHDNVHTAWHNAKIAIRPIAAAYGRNTAVASRALDTDIYLFLLKRYGYIA
jgi:hypothetical protein